jgi:hypothetical protein
MLLGYAIIYFLWHNLLSRHPILIAIPVIDKVAGLVVLESDAYGWGSHR